MTVGSILSEPMLVHGVVEKSGARRRVAELLDRVGLPATAANRYPHEFSGGQRQRIGIASQRLALSPQVHRVRRTRQRPRRLRASPGPQPPRRPAARPQTQLPFHRPQPRRRRALLRPRRRHVPRPHRRNRRRRRTLQKSQASLHRRPPLRRPETQPPSKAKERGARIVLGGEVPSPSNPPSGCPFPPPLPPLRPAKRPPLHPTKCPPPRNQGQRPHPPRPPAG